MNRNFHSYRKSVSKGGVSRLQWVETEWNRRAHTVSWTKTSFLWAREWVSERVNERSEHYAASKEVSGVSELASGWASGLVLSSGFLVVLNYSASTFGSGVYLEQKGARPRRWQMPIFCPPLILSFLSCLLFVRPPLARSCDSISLFVSGLSFFSLRHLHKTWRCAEGVNKRARTYMLKSKH